MMLLKNYSVKEISKMANPYINTAYEVLTNVIIKTISISCRWLEILILMARWIARQASAKWIGGALQALEVIIEMIPVVSENLFYDVLDICSGLAVSLRRAWAFRRELINEYKGV